MSQTKFPISKHPLEPRDPRGGELKAPYRPRERDQQSNQPEQLPQPSNLNHTPEDA